MKLKREGIQYSNGKNTYIIKKNLVPLDEISALPNDIRHVFITTKCNPVLNIVSALNSRIKENYTLIMMTNGLIEEKVMEIHDNIISCSITYGATLLDPASTLKTSEGEIYAGRWMDNKKESDEEICELIALIDPCCWTNNIIGIKYSKLLINCATASFGLISGLKLGEILEHKYMRLAFLILLTEGIRISEKLNIKIEKISGLDLKNLILTPSNISSYERKDNILKSIGKSYSDLRSSSLASVERGEKSEIPFLNGYFVEKGKELGINTLLNEKVVEICNEIELGRRKSSIEEMKNFEKSVLQIAEKYYLNPWKE